MRTLRTCWNSRQNADTIASADFIGYSVRTQEWRYTEWLRFNGTALHGDFGAVVAKELYDHRGDDGGAHDWDRFENENVADGAQHAALLAQLSALLKLGFPPGA